MVADLQLHTMTTTQKVAALLIVLGPTTASEVLKNITDDDLLEQVTLDIASLNKVPTELLNGILEEFKAIFQASNYLSAGGMDYAKELLEKAYGGDQAKKILDRLVVLMWVFSSL